MCSTHKRNKVSKNILIEEPQRKSPFGRSSSRWENNFLFNIKELYCKLWIEIAQNIIQ
jgi:hypothetical protein